MEFFEEDCKSLARKGKLPPGMATKSIEVRVKLHNEALAAGKRRGLGSSGVYERALKLWLATIGEGVEPVDTPFGQMKPEDRRTLLAVLRFLHSPREKNDIVQGILDLVVKRYGEPDARIPE